MSRKEESQVIEKEGKVTEQRRPNRRSKQRRPKQKPEYTGKNGNDISWHAKEQVLLDAAAAIPWSWATGKNITVPSVMQGQPNATFSLPTIAALRVATVPGVGSKHSDAINIASQALYTDIRRNLKSANQYEASDVMIYVMACADILQMTIWMRRLYATTPLYSFTNASLPDALIKAQGVNPSDLHNRATEFRSRINQLIYKASQIWMPKGFDYITRAKWLFGGYFSEGDSIKDQIYMFTPGLFRKYVYDETADYAGSLEPFVPIKSYVDDASALTVDDLCDYLDQMIEALIGDSDFQNIAGDLYNCYGAGGVETFEMIPEDAIIYPTFSEEVLEQIQNARCLNAYAWAFENFDDYLDVFKVSQNETNNVMIIKNQFDIDFSMLTEQQKNLWKNGVVADSYYPLVNVHKDPSTGKTMIITRDTNVLMNLVQDGDKFTVTTEVASEIVLGIDIVITRETDGAFQFYEFTSSGTRGYANTAINTTMMMKISNFHYFPIIYSSLTANGAPASGRLGELDEVSLISPIQLQDLNRVDLMSLLAVPNIGKVSK
jgi:hypothetical protein